MNKKTRIVYWMITAILCSQLLFTGVADIILARPVVQSITHVGFPVSMIPFLGILKILGVLTLLFVPNYDLRIGAYAGILFYSLGAITAHATIGDSVQATLPAVLMGVLCLSSYFLWKRQQVIQSTDRINAEEQQHKWPSQPAGLKRS